MIQHRYDRTVRHHGFALRVLAMALPSSLGMACSNGDVSLGEGALSTRDLVQSSRCSESSILAEDVFVANQAELDALAGCEQIEGRLSIDIFEGADLAPLASLRSVSSYFEVGMVPYIQNEEAQAAYDAVFATGFLPSLHGLEALEHVGSIQLNSLLVNDLSELESLRQIDGPFILYDVRNITSLTGLEAARPSRVEIIQCPMLETLNGFTFGDSSEGLYLEELPALTNIDAYASVVALDGSLWIYGTGLRTLPDLELISTQQIAIEGNADLVDVSGLRNLSFVRALQITDNPLLREFPALPELEHIERLDVIGNGMAALSLSFPALQTDQQPVGNRIVAVPTDELVIASNPNLLHVSVPAGYPLVRNFLVYDNASLRDIDFGSMKRADLLVIDANPVLESVALPSLTGVGSLEVTNNPKLVPRVFDEVKTLERSITGNAVP